MRISDWSSDVCSSDLVLARRAEVGELLRLHRVDLKVVRLRILADDHALIQRLAGRDEEDAALFERAERIGDGFAIAVRDQDAILAALDHALVRAIFLEQAVHNPGAARVGPRSDEHTSDLQSLMRISYAVLRFEHKKSLYNYQLR